MSMLDWSQCPAVESIPGKVSGAWVFRGTRMPVATVFENLEAGASMEEILEWFDLTREQVTMVLDFAARSLEAPAHRQMLILFDHGTPAPLRSFLKDHTVKKTKDLGWDTLSNGELLRAAEEATFEVFLTTDKNICYQQNLAERVIAIVVLGNSRWPVVQRYVDRVVAAVSAAKPGSYSEVEIPDR